MQKYSTFTDSMTERVYPTSLKIFKIVIILHSGFISFLSVVSILFKAT